MHLVSRRRDLFTRDQSQVSACLRLIRIVFSVLATVLGSALLDAASAANDAAISLRWAITVNGTPSTCQAVGAKRLRVILRGSNGTTKVGFRCDKQAAQFLMSGGTYTVKIKLLDGVGISMANVAVGKVQLVSGYVTDIGGYTFAF